MKIIPGSRRHRYAARIGVFLVAVALIAGMVGCTISGGGIIEYDLYISSSTGGSVAIPGEGYFAYAANTTVNLVAEPDDHHHFVNWTGDIATIGNVTSAATNITIYDSYSITANFELDTGWYSLTISSEGGSVTTPGEGYYVYAVNTTVDLVAEPDAGYPFLKWAGDVGTVADVQAAATNITMHDSYSITSHFGIQIWDWHDLDAMRDNLGGRYYLMVDVDSTTAGYVELASPTANDGKGWEPIGIVVDNPFNGTFDGQGYEIRDLFIYRPDEGHIGFFGAVNDGIIRDIGVVNVTVTGYADVGALAGSCTRSTVNYRGFVSDSYSSGSVTGEDYGIGGLVGHSSVPVSNSYSTASVSGNVSVGGLLGMNSKAVSNCSFNGIVTGYWNVGGLVGESYDSINDCYSIASVTGHGAVGGIVGGSKGGVYRCYSSGSVTGNVNVGGIVGGSGTCVRNSYSTSSVNGDKYVGGLMGCCGIHGSVNNSYSTGSVTGNEYVGGLVGYNSYGTVSNSFWDTETSGQATSDGGTGKTTAQMKSIATFSGATWDIVTVANPGTRNISYIWNIVDPGPVTYPFLSWQP